MGKLLKPDYIDKPWKVTVWILFIDTILRFPLRFFGSYITPETMDVFFMIRMIIFLIAVFLTGVLYVKTIKKAADKNLRFRVALYYTIYSAIGTLVLYNILGSFLTAFVGGLVEIVISLVAGFLAIYFILSLTNKFLKKQVHSPRK